MAEEEAVTVVSTDEAILTSIGEGNEPTTTESTDGKDTGTQANVGEATPPASTGQSTDPGRTTLQTGKDGSPKGLVKDGKVIAQSGADRRHFEVAKQEKLRADTATREVETLTAQLKAINDAGTVGTQFGLSPEEVTTGAQLISSYKKNPLETIQYMLTQAQSNGIDVSAITGGSGADMSAVKTMLDNALKPLMDDRQKQLDTQVATERATKIYNDFSTAHPDAKVHENALAQLVRKDPSLSPEAAYLTLRNFYLEKGLDWTKPLETLKQEAEVNTSGDTPPQPPEGGNVSQDNVTDTAQVVDVNTSTDDIIRQSMKEAGIT